MRGKKGYRARSYRTFRKARVAPRGRMSAREPWFVYLLLILSIAALAGLLWRHFHGGRG
jgi:hypothetical protein